MSELEPDPLDTSKSWGSGDSGEVRADSDSSSVGESLDVGVVARLSGDIGLGAK